nr:MAG TPA: hypothetical protein [Caudoviricetes sp.]
MIHISPFRAQGYASYFCVRDDLKLIKSNGLGM